MAKQQNDSIYSSLAKTTNKIRLLLLRSAQNYDDPLICAFKIVSLDEVPAFEALSYVWGEVEENQYKVNIDGVDLPIRRNLWDFLHWIRSKNGSRCLWVDAVCINQDDLEERGHQVRLMNKIYASAAWVIAWVHVMEHSAVEDILDERRTEIASVGNKLNNFGELLSTLLRKLSFLRILRSTETTKASKVPRDDPPRDDLFRPNALSIAFHFIHEAAKECSSGVHDESGNVAAVPTRIRKWHSKFMSTTYVFAWTAVVEFLNHTYWTRLWIFQEYVLPHQFYFRTKNAECVLTDFNAVFEAVSAAYWERPESEDDVEYMFRQGVLQSFLTSRAASYHFHRRQYHRLREARPNVEPWEECFDLLRIADSGACQDPLDKIYATLGLADECFVDLIPVDYRCSLQQLYERVLAAFLTSYNELGQVVCYSEALQATLTKASVNELLPGSLHASDTADSRQCRQTSVQIEGRMSTREELLPRDDEFFVQPIALSVAPIENKAVDNCEAQSEIWESLGVSTFIVMRHATAYTFYTSLGLKLSQEILHQVCVFEGSSTEIKFLPLLTSTTHYMSFEIAVIDGAATLMLKWVSFQDSSSEAESHRKASPVMTTTQNWFQPDSHDFKRIPLQITWNDLTTLTSTRYTALNVRKPVENKPMPRIIMLSPRGPTDFGRMSQASDRHLQLIFRGESNPYENPAWGRS